ncbi:MAG: metal ABC transporter ATP-binding protein [Planctomycetota bacterium]
MTKDERSAEEVLITLENVSLGYGGSPVLRGVDLVVRRNDFLGMVGPNGAGKTTLFRGIIGLLKPSTGRIRISSSPEGTDTVLGYVPQVQNLDAIYPLTVREVVRMGGYNRISFFRFSGRKDNLFLDQCLDDVGMKSAAGKRFNRLSCGQKQRVLIARALFTRSDVLLLDEPTSGADHEAEKKVMTLLKNLNNEGHTILMICHEWDALQQVVKEVLWVSRGHVYRDSPAQLKSERRIREMYDENG